MKRAKKLYRCKKHGVVGGVIAGQAEYFNKDPLVFRLGYLATFLLTGKWLQLFFFYVFAWIFTPKNPSKYHQEVKKHGSRTR